MDKQYGFYLAKYENGAEIDSLMTGDGKTQFTDIIYPDGSAAIGISYGFGKGVGITTEHNRDLDGDMLIKWQVKFENQKSVDAMIKTLLKVKNHLAA